MRSAGLTIPFLSLYFRDRFGPVDIGQGYMLDYIQNLNAGSLYDKLTGAIPGS